MTDKQRLAKLRSAVDVLKRTTKGYTPNGVYWRRAMKLLAELEDDLEPSRVPALGPIVQGGKSVLLHDLTHATSGLPLFPAFDDGFGRRGIPVLAPEPCVVYKQSSAQGGDAFYIRGDSRIEYWVGHVAAAPANARRFRKGERMAVIANLSQSDGGPHVHLGINARPLIGKTLVHHTNYTHGAPTVGVQLAAALEA